MRTSGKQRSWCCWWGCITHPHLLSLAKKVQPVARYCPSSRNCANITQCRQTTLHSSGASRRTIFPNITRYSHCLTCNDELLNESWQLIIYTNGYLLSFTFSSEFVLFVLHFKLKDDDIQAFLEEATVLDPRFKSKNDRDEIWERVRASAVAAIEKVFEFDNAFRIYLLWDPFFLHCKFLLKVSEPRETQVHADEKDRED